MKIAEFDTKNVLIVAELSANHAGSLELAKRTISAAKRAGADAIKIQTYTPESLTLNSQKDDFLIKGGLWDGQNYYELYKSAMTPREWHKDLFETAKNEGLICFSSPFCADDADFLEQFDPPAYKIASFEANDAEFIEFVAKKNKPIIISTGIATRDEIRDALNACKNAQNHDVMLLKCTSAYPAPISELNLNAMQKLAEFGCEFGLSDHSMGFLAPVLAVALGAQMIEKHFILDKSVKSADSAFSMDEAEFSQMVRAVKDAKSALGSGEFSPPSQSSRTFARSLYSAKDIKKGEIINETHIACVRPSFGLHPREFKQILGKRARADIEFATALKNEMFEG